MFVFALFDAGNLAVAHVAGSAVAAAVAAVAAAVAAVFAAVESLKTFEPFSCAGLPSEASGNRCHMSR